MQGKVLIGSVVLVTTLVGCSSTPHDRVQAVPAPPQNCCRSVHVTASRTAIAKSAAHLVGARAINMGGRRIEYDCAGVTRAVFLQYGIDLYESRTSDPRANGVRMIHNHIRQYGRLHRGPAVRPGDLVFFDNTWDSNRDGKTNDSLTHVGIVEKQDQDGTITFISRVAGAVERYHMNLGLPNIHRNTKGKLLNDYIRRRDSGDPARTAYLTGELFAGFGTRIGL